MRTERNRDGTFNVWMNRSEFEQLAREAKSQRREIALRLMGDCGLRVGEVPDVCPEHIERTKDGSHHMLEVVSAKDTSGEYSGGKYREAWLPVALERSIHRYRRDEGIDAGEPLFDVSIRTLQNWVDDAAARAAEETGDDNFRRVSSHDLRRCWGHHLLVREAVNPRVVMGIGGWSSYEAIEPYLQSPTEEVVVDEMTDVQL